MRKFLCFCFLAVFIAIEIPAFESGDWINTVTREVKTPHLKWAEPLAGGPLRVLFITDAGSPFSGKGTLAARMVAEWAQRMELDYEVITADCKLSTDKKNPYLAVFDDNHGRAANMYTGTQSHAKSQELEEKLQKSYELYVFNRIAFSALPVTAKKIIIGRVLDGAGLILINELNTGLPNLTKYPSEELFKQIADLCSFEGSPETFSQMAAAGNVVHRENLEYSVFTQKKGRIAQVAITPEPDIGLNGQNSIYYIPEWSPMFAVLKGKRPAEQKLRNEAPVPLWWGEFETLNADFLRLFHRIAGREPLASLSCPVLKNNPVLESREALLPLVIKNPANRQGFITARIRSDENKIISENRQEFTGNSSDCQIPFLPAGKYFLDLILQIDGKTEDFGVLSFQVKSPQKIQLIIADDRIYDGKDITFKAILASPAPDGKFRVTLADSPYDRIWYSQEFKIEQELKLRDWYIPNAAALLRVELLENGKTVAYARKMLFRPEGNRLPGWMDFIWGGSLTPIHGLMNFSEQGWNGVTQSLSRRRGNIPNHMIMGEIPMPWGPLNSWFMTNQRNKCSSGYRIDPKTGETVPDWNFNNGASSWEATAEEQKKLNQMSPDMIERPAAVREVFRIFSRATRISDYGVSVINLGDETAPGYDTYTGKYITEEFHKFLQRRFDTIGELNKAWGRSYAGFNEIPLLTTGEATAQRKLPEGAAARLFAENNYFDVHRTIGTEIQRTVPGAYYGPNSTAHPGELDYPEINASFDHPRDIASLTLRYSLRPDNLYIPLFGYGQKAAAWPNRNYWACAISGAARGHMYFAGNVTFDGGTLCADFRDKQPNVTEARLMMHKGVGSLIRSLKIGKSPLAMITSYPSWKANILAADYTCSPIMSVNPLLTYANEHGYNFDYLTVNDLQGRLGQYQVLFLAGLSALSESEAAEIVNYARNGGTVIADLNPGIYNEHLGMPERNPLAELFGNLKPAPINAALAYQGIPVKGVEGLPPMQERKIGKGRAILLNFTLADLMSNMGSTDKYNRFVADFLSSLNLKPLLKSEGLPPGSFIRLSHGDGFSMIAFANDAMSADGRGGGKVSVTFPKPGFIYEAMKGYLTQGQTATVSFDPPFRFITCFKERQVPPALNFSSSIATPGQALLLDLTGLTVNRVYNLEIYDPQNKFAVPRNEIGSRLIITPDGKSRTFPLHFAYSDLKGVYKIVLTDVATGLSSNSNITLQ